MYKLSSKPFLFLPLLAIAAASPALAQPLPAKPAPAAEAAPIRPAAGWVVDFAEAQCLVSRRYGAGEDQMTLLLKPSPIGDVMQVALVRPGRRDTADQVAASIGFDAAPMIETRALLYGASKATQVVSVINLSMEQFAAFRGSKRVRFDVKDGPARPLLVDKTTEVAAAIDECLESLRDHWNIGPERAGRLRQHATPKKSLASWIDDEDYPAIAAMRDQSGRTRFAMLIDEKGGVADCFVQETSGIPVLDAQSCAVFRQRAKFDPALGTDGKPVRSMVESAIRWIMPDESEVPDSRSRIAKPPPKR